MLQASLQPNNTANTADLTAANTSANILANTSANILANTLANITVNTSATITANIEGYSINTADKATWLGRQGTRDLQFYKSSGNL